jgi:outer membrane protein assembly factor BamE (lipoprotein component of BamABCDE complex)
MKTTRSRSRLLIAAALAVALSACATVQIGDNFDLDTFKSKVQRGVTTQAQVRGWLGAPRGTGQLVETGGALFDEWTYYFGNGKLNQMQQATFKMLQVRFDQQGLVQGYSFSGGTQ